MMSGDLVRRVAAAWFDSELSDEEAEELARAYRATADRLASFPTDELSQVEPPLRSAPGPVVRTSAP